MDRTPIHSSARQRPSGFRRGRAGNASDFTGIATTKFNALSPIIDDAEIAAAGQQSGFREPGQQFEIKTPHARIFAS